MRTPLVVITGVAPLPMDTAAIALSWDLPRAVSVQHRIDPEAQVLTRVVSDQSGVLEREEIPLEHACVHCALREDILPTLERLARAGRWEAIVSALPVGATAEQLGTVMARDTRLARHLKLTSVHAALDGSSLIDDLLGDHLLRERGLHNGPDDDRGVGEVGCSLVEYADIVAVTTEAGPEDVDLIRALQRPDALLVTGAENLSGSLALASRHDYARTSAWASLVRDADLPGPDLPGTDLPGTDLGHAWRLELSSPRPFHPDRLLDGIERLGTGPHRTRGCFWLPTRPGEVQHWDGSGGQLSIGHWGSWGRGVPRTRLVFTGVGETPDDLAPAFEELLLTPGEALLEQHNWSVHEDGLEPWLGPIENAA